ncbi:MAG: hypothetical protein RI998_71 [Pseudomonadota bacterium]
MARHKHMGFIWAALLLLMASCAQRQVITQAPPPPSVPETPALPAVAAPAPPPVVVSPPVEVAMAPPQAAPPPKLVSSAKTLKAYRADAAKHIYQTYQDRIYKGKMPAMLKAVGVVEVAVDQRGQVQDIVWLRAPKHVPEVMREIEKALRQAAPYPAPVHLQHVKYTETWLWHASGRFQLDTLTEGQY